MIPTHGAVTSAFLLANAIRYESARDFVGWVRAAQDRSAFLAAAADHEPVAKALLRSGMALEAERIGPSVRLRAVSERADRATLLAIAAMLLEIDPPSWLQLAVVGDDIRYEVIPSADREGMSWLDPEFEQILRDAHPSKAQSNSVLALGLGRAAELAVVAALDATGASPVHVSEISDRFGYDIESTRSTISRWEVKGCTELTANGFHLTRNEYEVSQRFPKEWVLVQVQFDASALVADEVNATHVTSIREVHAPMLETMVPSDSEYFRWESSAFVSPPVGAWVSSTLLVPPHFTASSLDLLGREILEMRGVEQYP